MEGNAKRWHYAIAIIQIPGIKESLHLAFNRAYSRSCVYLARGWYLTGRNAPISKTGLIHKLSIDTENLNMWIIFWISSWVSSCTCIFKKYLSLTMLLSVMWLDCFHLMLCNSDLCDNFYYISYPQFCFGKPVKRLTV